MKAKWLFDEHPILVDKELASVIGLNEAIVLQQLNYWLHSKSAKQIDGQLWIYNTYDNWKKDNFPFWSRNTIRRALNSCIKKGLVITGNFNKAGFDKTKWYSINTQKLDEVMGSACDQNGQMEVTKMGKPIPYTTQRLLQRIATNIVHRTAMHSLYLN